MHNIKPQLEKRFIDAEDLEIRIDETEGEPTKITCYAARFNVFSKDLGGFVEILRPGLFKRSLESKRDVIANLDHDNTKILARTKADNLRLSEDSIGLRFEMDIPNTTVGKDTAENIKNGNLRGASFAFIPIKENFREEPDRLIRELLDVDLFDVSVVTTPVYEQTEVSLRSLEEFRAKQAEATEVEDTEATTEEPAVEEVVSAVSADNEQPEDEFTPDVWLELEQKQRELE